MSNSRDPGQYEVGYGKPPKHSQFKKGESRNPRGRPPGTRNLATLLAKALDEKITVIEHGRRRKIAKRAAIIGQLVNRSAQADLKAMTILFNMLQDIERRDGVPTGPASLTEADRETLQLLRNWYLADDDGGSDV